MLALKAAGSSDAVAEIRVKWDALPATSCPRALILINMGKYLTSSAMLVCSTHVEPQIREYYEELFRR